MPKASLMVLTAVAFFVFPSLSFAADYPGLTFSTWGQLSYDNDNISGSGAMGFANVGVDWYKLPGDFAANTYVEYRYRSRALNEQYYDANGPAVGIEFRNPYVSIGADYYWERWPAYPPRPTTSERMQYYITSYLQWNLDEKGTAYYHGLSGSLWIQGSYDNDNISGSGIMGFLHQAVDWARLPGGILFSTYAEYRWRSRTENQKYFDAGGPAVGMEFNKSYFTLGVDYYWERLPVLGESSERVQAYLTWFFFSHP